MAPSIMSMNSTTLDLGQVVGDTYRITAQLGAGGMGAVFAADHLRLPGKRVAIKVLHAIFSSGDVLLRFRREAEIASRIGHPNIVEVLDFNTLPNGSPYLVMELLTGESLSARLARGPLPEGTALSITRQIGSALAAAHRMGVVHRDLKPDNIFLCPLDVDGEMRDHVKVLDFGISKIRGSQTVVTQDAAVMGTPNYMSPEQASGKNQEIDARTDVFALGAIVYQMLCGRIAFPGESYPQVIFHVVFEPHPPLGLPAGQVSPRVVAAIDRALAKKAADRFADMAGFILALTGRPLGMASAVNAAVPSVLADLGTLDTAMSSASSPAAADLGTLETAMVSSASSPATADLGTLDTAIVSSAPAPAVAGQLSLPRTEVLPSKAPGAARPNRGSKKLVLAAAGFLACVLGAGFFLLRGKVVAPPIDRPASFQPHVITSAPVAPDAGAVAHPAGVDAALLATERHSEPGAAAAGSRSKHAAKEESLLPAVAAELDAAMASLNEGNVAEAVRKARHSLFEQKTSRAFAILTRAYCATGDLGSAQAALRNVAAAERARVVRACKSSGMEL
jgi:serine/threonine-protein kinase